MITVKVKDKYRAMSIKGTDYVIVLSDGTSRIVSRSTWQRKNIGSNWLKFADKVKT